MRHRKSVNKLGRDKAHRKATISNLSSQLILNEYIVTSVAKAKACKSFTDRVISIGRKKDEYARRRLNALLRNELAADKLITVYSDRYKDRVGGYVRIVKLSNRKGDNSPRAKLFLVGSDPYRKVKKTSRKKKQKADTTAKSKGKDADKKGLVDRVKGIRGKIFDKKEDKVQKDQVDKKPQEITTKSRSGI